ncbi:MAG: glycosyltransferase [Saprospiraceae bacterium]|nr:glycosyltransferase [Saprospiraceae bacterium]
MQPNVVFFSLFRTDNPYSSISLSMARELAQQTRVVYVNHPYSIWDVVKGLRQKDKVLRRRLWRILFGQNAVERLDSIPENFVAVTPPVTLPINWLPPGRVYDFFQRFNNGIVLRAIRRALQSEQVRDFIFINCYNPFYAGWLPPGFGAKACIYHCIDDITQNAYTARHGEQLENEACRQADFTFVTSSNLARLKAPVARRIVSYFNAADFSVFQKVLTETYPRPELLAGREGPVIGFVGNLDDLRIDYALLKKIALHFPEKTLLLVGPLNSKMPAAIGLDRLPNVVFAGARALHDLPPLLQHMDCVLIPFLCNTLTFSIYPLKINEYLAAGKPVVSTCFSEDIRTFAGHCYLAETPEVFLRQIEHALQENDPERIRRRIALAQTNTWEARIRQLWKVLEGAENR